MRRHANSIAAGAGADEMENAIARNGTRGDAGVPLVTIVVPVYNGERYLRESLQSIVEQSYPNIDVLVMDDASSDRTPQILASFGDKISVYRQPTNRGQFANVSDGVARASGELIAVYHSDDIYDPNIVAREAAFMSAHPEAGAVFALDTMIDEQGRPRGEGQVRLPAEIRDGGLLDYQTIFNVLLLYRNRIFRAPSSMVRASAYRETGPYRGAEYPVAADFEMFLRIARAHPIGILNEHLFKYRWGHGNADQIDRLMRVGPDPYFRIMEEHLASGARAWSRPEALAAHAAHAAQDALMRVVNLYILDNLQGARAVLGTVRLTTILKSPRVQRARLTALYAALQLIVRAPRAPGLAAFFFRRWYGKLAERQSVSGDPLPWLKERGYA